MLTSCIQSFAISAIGRPSMDCAERKYTAGLTGPARFHSRSLDSPGVMTAKSSPPNGFVTVCPSLSSHRRLNTCCGTCSAPHPSCAGRRLFTARCTPSTILWMKTPDTHRVSCSQKPQVRLHARPASSGCEWRTSSCARSAPASPFAAFAWLRQISLGQLPHCRQQQKRAASPRRQGRSSGRAVHRQSGSISG